MTDGNAESIFLAVIAVFGSLPELAENGDVVLVENEAVFVENWIDGQACDVLLEADGGLAGDIRRHLCERRCPAALIGLPNAGNQEVDGHRPWCDSAEPSLHGHA